LVYTMDDKQDGDRLITYFSAGETGLTEFSVKKDGTGDFYSIEAGNETSYEFALDAETAREYRDQLDNNIRQGSVLKEEMGSGNTEVSVYREGEHHSGRLTRKGRKVIDEMLDAFNDNKKN